MLRTRTEALRHIWRVNRCLTYHNQEKFSAVSVSQHNFGCLSKHNQDSLTKHNLAKFHSGSVVSMGGRVSQPSPAIHQFINEEVSKNCVTIFSKTSCGFCKRTKRLLDQLEVPYKSIELNCRDDGPLIQQELQVMTGSSTVPSVFVNGQYIGGSDDTNRLQKEGKLLPLVRQCMP
ncbi:glutaredoxin-2, mitochondrial [Lingula anatina]|uniref:Glutaredoxin-2, mitochondrial n=1 Tax=Lingula anatina TaxID=7574 RepID=A0A1S3JSH8_LINAN|nr:glutaredoxin-2, mitochondrial [Lingula anatina]XP_013413341.1 glutaredoxin-2, mitochondrial [Lingula anatina]XP_013413342.1 glutaredoxin-2, mitochondrial [Lingula anatina]|eukprot:XP_013413340.1 glutaredoxin-2, mitochondrial [Lingula anatina]